MVMLTESPAREKGWVSGSNDIVLLSVVPSCSIETFPPLRRKSLKLVVGLLLPLDWGEASPEGVLPLSDGGGEAAARITIGDCKKICTPIVIAPLSGHSSWLITFPFLSKFGLSGALCPKGAAFTENA